MEDRFPTEAKGELPLGEQNMVTDMLRGITRKIEQGCSIDDVLKDLDGVKHYLTVYQKRTKE